MIALPPSSRVATRVLLAAAVVLVAACSSPTTRFYTLVAPETAPVNRATGSAGFAFELAPATVPPQVDQAQLMIRRSDAQLAPLDFDRWTAPLGDEIREALSQNLARELGAPDVYRVPRPEQLPVYKVQTLIRRFDSVPGQYALVEATWSIRLPAKDAAPLACEAGISEPVGSDPGSIVQGYQQALHELAMRMALSVRALRSGSGAACPG